LSFSKSVRLLYGVSSVGLGHVRRSLAIADEIRRLRPDSVSIEWVAAEPALSFLKQSGESVLEISTKLASMSSIMESQAPQGRVTDMSRVARLSSRRAKENYALLRPSLSDYDILVQDEFVETLFSFMWEQNPPIPQKRAVVTDYLRLETGSKNPIDRLILYYANRMLKRALLSSQVRIFADEPDSLPSNGKLRRWAETNNFQILGPIIGEVPEESKEDLRRELLPQAMVDVMKSGLKNRVVLFTIGGSSIGNKLINLAVENAEFLSEKLGAAIVVLTGPRVQVSEARINSRELSKRLVIVPFTTSSLRYFAMADCVITQAGASTLNEVAEIGIPCVAIPIANHWEQQANAERFARKRGFEILQYADLSRERLVGAILSAVSKGNAVKKLERSDTKSPQKKAAELILTLISYRETRLH